MSSKLPNSGIFLINKQDGYSSHKVVNYIKKLTGYKTGHGGTLDPMACGVLIIAYGNATRLLEYALESDKEYIFQIRWGTSTDSYDATGKVTAKSIARPSLSEVKQALPNFTGMIEQAPPIFSALKIAGQPAYKLARKGEDVSLKKRQVNIKSLEILEHNQHFTLLKTSCSKGTYIRSLAHDLATYLNCPGHVDFLQRTQSLGFSIEQSTELTFSDQNKDIELLRKNYLETEHLVKHLPNIELNQAEYERLIHGQTFERNNLHFKEETFMRATFRNDLIGIVRVEEQTIYPRKTFVNR